MIRALLTEDPKRSNGFISRSVGCHHSTVQAHRRALEEAGAIAPRVSPAPRMIDQDHGGQLLDTPEGNTYGQKHGVWSHRLVQPRADKLADELRAVVPGATPADETAIRLLALILARIETVTSWLDSKGLFKDKRGNPQPILSQLSKWETTAARLCDQLGLTPTARARLGVVKPGLDGYAAFLEALNSEGGNGAKEAANG